MKIEEIRKAILELLAEKVEVKGELRGDESLREALNLHSLLLLELTVSFEDRFNIMIPDQDLGFELFSTLDHLTDYIANKTAATV